MHMGMSVHTAVLYSCTGHALLKGSASKWHCSHCRHDRFVC